MKIISETEDISNFKTLITIYEQEEEFLNAKIVSLFEQQKWEFFENPVEDFKTKIPVEYIR